MPFDPTLPQPNTLADADQMRAQLNGLKADYEAQIAGIPAGPPGPAGAEGAAGPPGAPGDPGVAGPAGPTAVLVEESDPGGADGTVWIRPSDGNLAVRVGGSWDNRGTVKGSPGDPGPAGPEGPQGLPGEVTAQQLTDAINGTSANSNGVALLGLVVSDPPTQAEVQSVADKLDEVIGALRR